MANDLLSLTSQDGHPLRAYCAGDEQASAGLIVIQEIFGVNSHIRQVCRDYARDGFRVLSPLLFDRLDRNEPYGIELGYSSEDIEKARGLAGRVGYFENPLLDISACLESFPAGMPVGVIGYCWGGTLAWLSACRLHPADHESLGGRLSCCVGYYGGMIGSLLDDPPEVPIMLHFGKRDRHIPISEVEKVRQAYPDIPLHLYEAGHGFNCSARPDYQAHSAQLARQRSLEFLRQNLAPS